MLQGKQFLQKARKTWYIVKYGNKMIEERLNSLTIADYRV